MSEKFNYVNEEEKFWKHSYRIHLQEFDTEGILVNADHEGAAWDYAIDYAEKQGWEGLFLTPEEIEEYENDGTIGDYMSGGNHCRYLSSLNYRLVQLD